MPEEEVEEDLKLFEGIVKLVVCLGNLEYRSLTKSRFKLTYRSSRASTSSGPKRT